MDGGERTVAGVRFVSRFARGSTANCFSIRKPPELVEKYLELAPRFVGANIVELGIAAGGSTALLALLTQPRKLVACELASERVQALDELVESRALRVAAHYDVDQADSAKLTTIVDQEFAGEEVDLVIDDASHVFEPTRASFEVLWPRLRSGGTYIIEDWAAAYLRQRRLTPIVADPDHPRHDAVVAKIGSIGHRPTPIHQLTIEMIERCGRRGDVAAVGVDPHWTSITKA